MMLKAFYMLTYITVTLRSGRVGMDFRASLLDESRRLAHASRELRRLCNDSVPLLRMPPEIIDYIIDYLVVDWSPFGTSKIDQHGIPLDVCAVVSLGWIKLGHVCHRLRVILLGRRQLWASTVCSIPSSHAREQILSRCGDEPLDLCANYSSAGALIHPAAIAFTFQHLPRARRLTIRETGSTTLHMPYLDTIEPALFSQYELPHLEMLELDLISTPERNAILTPDVCELPNMIAPRLTSLLLCNVLLSFPPGNLTFLSITFLRPTYLYEPAHFFHILRQCGKLQVLELKHCIPLLLLRLEPRPTLSIPSLKRLMLTDDANRCIGLWSSMENTGSTAVSLCLNAVQDTFTLERSHLEVVSTVFHVPEASPPALGLSIFDSGIDSSVIVLFTERPGALNSTWTGIFREGFTEQYNIRFKGIVGGPSHFMQLLSRASSAVDPHTITTLELSSIFHYEPPSWSAALAPFVEVHTLYIESMPRPAMLLSFIAPEQNANPETPFILPKLRFLWLSVLDLRVMNDDLAVLDRFSFSRIFSSRIQQGTRIDHLRINKLIMDKTLAENVVLPRLRALVPVVECESIIEE